MKKSKFKNLPGIVFIAMLVVIISSCKEKKTADGDASSGKATDTSLTMPDYLTEVPDSEAEGYIKSYQDSTFRDFGEGLPKDYGMYLFKKYDNDIILSFAFKDSIVFTIFVIPFKSDSVETYSYKYFTDKRNLDPSFSTGTIMQQIPVCRPGQCPCKYYPPPCN